MKLYATVTSERASKGQGGNEFIGIDLKDENQVVFGTINVYPTEDLYTFVRVHGKGAEFSRETKGKKQKDEIKQQLKDDREQDAFNAGLQ